MPTTHIVQALNLMELRRFAVEHTCDNVSRDQVFVRPVTGLSISHRPLGTIEAIVTAQESKAR
jgi:hypothetical protein